MNLFAAPKRVTFIEVGLSTVVIIAALLLIPDSELSRMNVDWGFGVFLVPVTFLVGILASWHYYRDHEYTSIDPFYIRAWWGFLSGFIAMPVCLVCRPFVAHLAFIACAFGAGPILGFHFYRWITKHRSA
jgi:hypothetical protein